MIEQKQTYQSSDQNSGSQTANPQTKITDTDLLQTEVFEVSGKKYLAEIARNEQKLIVLVKNMRPENDQEISQQPKRMVRRSRFC